ncbi:hypothetical protein L9F63_004358 [Diploptera punctata]|uniref:Translation machinery-associated protein 16 n=1 Tax=Diploptera punctata TaxID=6984 RepID=A0AAD7ZGN0_DIPPU|nr:hypothetical protein L9F63_004358 [Diploptera punctata]
MPKSVKKNFPKKILHPKSRKVQQLSKRNHRKLKVEKLQWAHQVKQNLTGEKFLWFRDHLEPDIIQYTPELTIEIIELYLSRFNEELEQIKLKHSIGNRKNRQHANREDIIRLTILQEEEEFATCGLEMPDLLDIVQLDMLRKWEGELRLLQNFKLKRYNRKQLLHLASSSEVKDVKTSQKTGSSIDISQSALVTQDNGTDIQNEEAHVVKQVDSCDNEKIEINEDTSMEVDT